MKAIPLPTQLLAAAALALAVAFVPAASFAEAKIDEAAPAFTLKDVDGKERSLADYKGKTVVLEWTNDGCPFVKKHYGSGNMQALQKRWTEKGVVWLTINTSAEGKQGHLSPAAAKALMAEQKAAPTAYLFDGDGKVGKLYKAQTTPHMYVIDGEGTLRYMGAIDDKATVDLSDVPKAKNYVEAALAELAEGKPVTTKATRAYGCSVKYAD